VLQLSQCKSVSAFVFGPGIAQKHLNGARRSRTGACQCTCEMKAFCDSSGARNAGGRLFQVVGPLTAKLCYPTADTRTEQVEFDWMHSPYPPLDNIQVMLIVWRSRGNIVRTAPCWVVWHNVHSQQHTYLSSSYRSSRLDLSHWDPYAVCRGGCLEVYYCNMVEWCWWDSSLIWKTNWFPSVPWHCWFGHMICKNRPLNDYNVLSGTLSLCTTTTGCRALVLSTRSGGSRYAEVAEVDRSNTVDTLPDQCLRCLLSYPVLVKRVARCMYLNRTCAGVLVVHFCASLIPFENRKWGHWKLLEFGFQNTMGAVKSANWTNCDVLDWNWIECCFILLSYMYLS